MDGNGSEVDREVRLCVHWDIVSLRTHEHMHINLRHFEILFDPFFHLVCDENVRVSLSAEVSFDPSS